MRQARGPRSSFVERPGSRRRGFARDALDRTEPHDQLLGGGGGRGGRRLEPAQRGEARQSGAVQLERGAREVGARDLGHLERAPGVVVVPRVEPDHAARAGAAGATGALRAAGAADRLDRQRRQAGPRRVPRDASQAAVDHADHAVDRHRGLGDVGREDHLALAGRAHRAVLLVGRQVAVQRQHREIEDRGDLGEVVLAAPDLAGPGQEHQHVTVEPVLRDAADRGGDLAAERPIVGLLDVLDRDLERPALGPHDRGAEERRDRLGVERRRHHHQAQLGPPRAQPGDQRQREIAVEVALVKLVDDHAADAAQLAVGEQPAGQDTLGREPDPRLRPDAAVEPDLVADLPADLTAPLGGDPAGREPRRQPPRLQHHDLAADHARVDERAGHPRRLAGSRRRDQHRHPAIAHRRDHLG